MYRTLEYTILFVVMALLQVFLFSRIGVSVYIHPLAYVAFIILLPMEIAPLLLLTLGLLMGVTMDVFMGTAGINTIATLFVAFCRPTLLNLLAGKDEVKDGGIPNVNRLGIKKFIKYASFMVLLHSTVFFIFETLSLHFFYLTLLRDPPEFGGYAAAGVFLPTPVLGQPSKTVTPWIPPAESKPYRESSSSSRRSSCCGCSISRCSTAATRRMQTTTSCATWCSTRPGAKFYDRNGRFLVQSKEAYDLMATPREVRPFDTALMSRILGVPVEQIRKELIKASNFSRRRASVIVKQLPKETKLRLEEHQFPGFFTVYRTVRSYPTKMAGNLLGYVGEVDDRILERDPYYRSGDYIGRSGIEQAYEEVLRGEKGVKIEMVDVHGIPKGSYANGIYDTLPSPGVAITCTIDARLQALAEELMEGKVGSVVAIEPETGEILVMANSPTYDPDELVGRDRGNNYMKLLNDPRRPLYNRAVMSFYPPGSTFKVIQGLIGMQEGVLSPSQTYPCHGGYPYGRGVKCHAHGSPLDLEAAIANSCNAYFCYVFRNIIENKKYKNIEEGFGVWADYVRSFGYGRKLGTDFTGELNGNVPSSEFYDKAYRGRWNGLTVISLSIGQGELGCTPLQMANMVATVANRGHYRTPHVVKRIHDRDSIDARFYVNHTTRVDARWFEPIVEGMYQAVNGGGTGRIAMVPGLDICGKTGTAQNPHGADNSTFFCFAPRNNPKIAVSVYIENGGFGATVAAPIASLLTELYLTDTIQRAPLVEYVKNKQIAYPYYERQQRK